MMFHIAEKKEIKQGKVTDVYFQRTVEVLQALGIDSRVAAEVRAAELPEGYDFAVLAGVEEVAELFQGMPVDIEGLPEGTVFYPEEPVLTISGKYPDFAIYETALLGLLCQASGVASKAARCRIAAGERTILSFGARRMHPALAPMIDRSAYIGGCDGVAVVKSAEALGLEPLGTIPHSLILLVGDTLEAARAFDKVVDRAVKRVALIDTFADEKFEALRVAEGLENLYAVRFDTPKTRRGDLLGLLEEVRWELDIRGFKHVKILVSGGLDEYKIARLNPAADAYGVGTALSNAPVINFSLDIVEIEGKPIAKKGKRSGAKRVYQCDRCGKREVATVSAPLQQCRCGGNFKCLSHPLLESGKLVAPLPEVSKIRKYVLEQLRGLDLKLL